MHESSRCPRSPCCCFADPVSVTLPIHHVSEYCTVHTKNKIINDIETGVFKSQKDEYLKNGIFHAYIFSAEKWSKMALVSTLP